MPPLGLDTASPSESQCLTRPTHPLVAGNLIPNRKSLGSNYPRFHVCFGQWFYCKLAAKVAPSCTRTQRSNKSPIFMYLVVYDSMELNRAGRESETRRSC